MIMKVLVGFVILGCITQSFAFRDYMKERDLRRQKLHEETGRTALFIQNEYKNYVKTGKKTSALDDMFPLYKIPADFFKYSEMVHVPETKQTTICVFCRSVIGVVMDFRRAGMSDADVELVATDLCISFEFQPAYTCPGIIRAFLPIVTYIIDNRPELTPAVACAIVLQGSNCVLPNPEQLEWSINIDPNTPAITDHKDNPLEREDDDLVIVHISDIHYDPRYFAGANANCDAAACCRSGIPARPEDAAGRWGHYRMCDTPWEAVADGIAQIRRQHPHIDFIYYTGDSIDHGIWEKTPELMRHIIQRISNEFSNTFGDIPVYSVLGNHEAQPVNQFAPHGAPLNISQQWVYDFLAEQWGRWLPESTKETMKLDGYYTVLVRPGLRIIAINNNHCITSNWWLLYDITNPALQLQWLHDTLLEAERNNEKVHLLQHVPSGSGSCLQVWSREYNRVINRFWNTIAGQFAGHTHRDEFYLYYSDTNPRYANNIQWNGGSATTYSDINHNYRIYYVDQDTYQVTDADSWIFNLTEANLTPERNPRWFKSFTFKEEFGASRLTPKGLHDLTEDLARDRTKLFRFWEHRVSLADSALNQGCGEGCLIGSLCRIVAVEVGDDRRCNELINIFHGTADN